MLILPLLAISFPEVGAFEATSVASFPVEVQGTVASLLVAVAFLLAEVPFLLAGVEELLA